MRSSGEPRISSADLSLWPIIRLTSSRKGCHARPQAPGSAPCAADRESLGAGFTVLRACGLRARHRRRAARRRAATSGACGSRRVGSANGPSQGLSRGGFHLRPNTTPDRCSAISAARALRASHQSAPLGLSFALICFCALLEADCRHWITAAIGANPWRRALRGS